MSVFKRATSRHMHVRTPITAGIIVLLVVLLSAFCYYRDGAPVPPPGTSPAAR